MTPCVLSLYFLLSLCSSISADGPTGLKVRITNRAPDVLKSFGQAYLKELVGKPFPDFQFKGMKAAKCKIKGLTLNRLDVDRDKVVVRFQQDSGLQFEFRDLNFTAELQREINVQRKIVDEGTVNVTGKGVRATIGVRLNQNQGRLSLEILNCEVKADKIAMKFHQGLGPVLNRFKKLFQHLYKTKICPAIKRHAVPKVNSMLANATMAMSLSKDLGINLDYSLSGDVTVTPNSLDVPFKGVVYHGDIRPTLPAAGVEPVFTESNRMAYVGISELLFQSAAQALYSHGPLQLDVPQIGTIENYVLHTWGLPEGGVEVELTEVPDVTISQDGVSVDVKAIAQSLVNPDLPHLPMTCQVRINVDMEGCRLILQALSSECKIEPKTIWGRFLATFVDTSSKISSFIEEWFDEGVLIPLPERLDFTQMKINYYPGFMVVGGDLNYIVQRAVLRSIHPSPTIDIDPGSSRKYKSFLFLTLLILYIWFCKRCF
ncbi:phospholipid transfer protein-like [Sander lucioperca]|uniref:phospholipid transfer protein-like n=1 Tax=Sander lucioperca TaxID=283035 RepID=UPI00125D00B9|nr:phospholipid transfer protein-like [Sander lucioperca]